LTLAPTGHKFAGMSDDVRANPWLNIPLADYEGHMQSPGVHQAEALSELFAEILAVRRPRSVAILGLAGGNGLEHLDASTTKRVLGLDVNAEYLSAARERYRDVAGLKLHCIDLANKNVTIPPVALVHAAMTFEHAGTGRCLENALGLVEEGGALSVVLQLPSPLSSGVSSTAYPSMQNLRDHFSLVDPEEFTKLLTQRNFTLARQRQRPLAGGKAFWVGVFERK